MDKKIIMLTGGGQSSIFMYNAVSELYPISSVVLEQKASKIQFLKRRVKKLGFFRVLGQVFFQAIIPRILSKSSTRRAEEIMSQYNLDNSPIPEKKIKAVTSVNSKECIDFLQKEKPDLIIVNGTRIISKKVLNGVDAVFLNTHAGITPKYRGVHGGYWALANDDAENFGVTVHLVDPGIDTGGIIYQAYVRPTPDDNFSTYSYLQTGEGVLLMKKAVTDFHNGSLTEIAPRSSESKLYSHPTIWYYLQKRWSRGVK